MRDRWLWAILIVCKVPCSIAWGFLVGAILGLPFGVYMTYKRYGHSL